MYLPISFFQEFTPHLAQGIEEIDRDMNWISIAQDANEVAWFSIAPDIRKGMI